MEHNDGKKRADMREHNDGKKNLTVCFSRADTIKQLSVNG